MPSDFWWKKKKVLPLWQITFDPLKNGLKNIHQWSKTCLFFSSEIWGHCIYFFRYLNQNMRAFKFYRYCLQIYFLMPSDFDEKNAIVLRGQYPWNFETKFFPLRFEGILYNSDSQVNFLLSWQVFQKFSRDQAEIMVFWDRISQNLFFFNFFIRKSPNFISNLNDDCSQLSFDVYNVFVAQKLRISEFLIELFFRLDPSTSATSRGRNFNLRNLKRVSNFS